MKEGMLGAKYDEVEAWCNSVVQSGHDLLFDVNLFDHEIRLASKRLKFPVESLNSFLRNVHLKRVKKHTYVIKNQLTKQILPEYVSGKSILELSKAYNFPPSLLCRSIIEKVTNLQRKKISEAMRNPMDKLNSKEVIQNEFLSSETLVSTEFSSKSNTKKEVRVMDPFSGNILEYSQNEDVTRLAIEVQEAILLDPLYGPRSDRERQIIGSEYELVLEQILHSMNIPFETETELKKRGTSKTPDILFLCPVSIKIPKNRDNRKIPAIVSNENDVDYEWKMICWIDSKALFGDIYTHQKNVLPQAEGYVHRFGPGLVLYWFGHGPNLDNGHGGDVIVSSWNAPKEFMLPTGEISLKGMTI